MKSAFYLGCQGWAHAPWRGIFFTQAAQRDEFLPQYAGVFHAVEGNTTFYALPPTDLVARWAEEAPAHFRFCFKFPKEISHERQLVGAEAETRQFFERLAPLAERCGPFFLQLHDRFGANRMETLRTYLAGLPREFSYAVEVRHTDFFDGAAKEAAFDAMLGELGMDRVNFDTRVLFKSVANDAATLEAQRKKPRVPVRFTAVGARPFVRFVGDIEIAKNEAAITQWAEVCARWIAEGRTPHFFVHHPDEAGAPALGRMFQAKLHALAPAVVAPPLWPCEREPRPAAQLDLF
ncbi:MAG: hypothetical protein CFE49_19740 [Pseudomonas sp. PGPPP3]|nr:MAG: hypothetical protein CFE49_19740 [Pseudomonas sp. PGPPP3]